MQYRVHISYVSLFSPFSQGQEPMEKSTWDSRPLYLLASFGNDPVYRPARQRAAPQWEALREVPAATVATKRNWLLLL